jgi:hypothetical protein
MKGRKPGQFGRLIAAVAAAERGARDKEEVLVDIMVSAFGAKPRDKKRLESLVRRLLPDHAASLRQAGRAPLCQAELEAEAAFLIEEFGRQRRARAASHRLNAYKPPLAERREFDGTVNVGEPGARLPDGYRLERDLFNLAKLTDKQRQFALEFIGRPLGPITVWPPGAASPRVVDLAQIWSSIANRSKAATNQIAKAKALMDGFEAKSKECARLLGEAANADPVRAKLLRAQANEAGQAADLLRKQAKQFGDAAYNNVRSAFWREVHRQPDLVEHLTKNMGLQFLSDGPNGVRGAPFFTLPDGRKEGLTLEHFARRNDDPRLSIDPGNLIVSPTTENVLWNEAYRTYTPAEFTLR